MVPLVILLFAVCPAVAETLITVTTTNDVVDGGDGWTSLREAINTANAGSDDYRIVVGGSSLFLYQLSGNGDNANATGDFDINAPGRTVSIVATRGFDLWASDYATINAYSADRIFHVAAGTLVLDHLILVNGRAIDNGHGSANGYGGGVLADIGTHVTLNNVAIRTCSAQTGYTFGGGVFVFEGAEVTIEGGELTGNYVVGSDGADGMSSGESGGAGCYGSGGALYVTIGATATVNRCTITGNHVQGGRGGDGQDGVGGFSEGPGGAGGVGGAAYGAWASVASLGCLRGDAVDLANNYCAGGQGGNGGDGGASIYGNGASGGNGGAGGSVYDSPRGIYVASTTAVVSIGGYGQWTYIVGPGGTGGVAVAGPGVDGADGAAGSYDAGPLKCLNISVYRSADEAGIREAFLGDLPVYLLATNGTLLCGDITLSSSYSSYNAGLCHNFEAAVVQNPPPPYGYRRGASPPSNFSREEGMIGRSATQTGSAYLIDPMYNGPIYVSPTGGDRYPYCTWDCAAKTIEDGEMATWTITGSVVVLAATTHVVEWNVNLGGEETVRGDGNDPSKVIVRGSNAYCFGLLHPQARLEGVTVTGGQALWGGGGVLVGDGTVDRCMVTGNRATQYGGGIFVYGTGTVRNCLVFSNSCFQYGGGVALSGAGTIENCTVYGNSATLSGGGLYVETNGTIRNTIVWSNTAPDGSDWTVSAYANADYCCARPLCGAPSITSDPVFANAPSGDFRLRTDSPCIDTGLQQSWMTGASDLRARPRVTGSAPDLGAYELGYFAITAGAPNAHGTISPSGVITCPEFDDYSFSMTPSNGCDLYDVYVDGVSIGGTNAYTFENVTSEHSISVLFRNYIYVSHSGSSVRPYLDWATAARTLAEATTAVTQASLILVTNGIYTITNTIQLAGAVTVKGANGATNIALVGQPPSEILLVLANPGAVLDGLTISGGSADHPAIECLGGAIRSCTLTGNAERAVWLASGSVMSNCLVTGNGRGIDGNGSRIEHCVVAGNGLYGVMLGSSPSNNVVEHCTIVSNTGPGVYFSSYSGTLRDSVIAYNAASGGSFAGGVTGAGLIDNCVIVGNTGAVGGVYLSSGLMRNTTIADNASETCGGAFCFLGGMVNCIVYSNRNTGMTTNRNVFLYVMEGYPTTLVTHCCTTPSFGLNCVTSAPRFLDTAHADYRLAAGSPCIDAGTSYQASLNDLLGASRPLDGDSNGVAVVDIGAYEFVHPSVDTDGDGMPDAWEVPNELDATYSNAQDDDDDDGSVNLDEYICDTRPKDEDDWFRIQRIRCANTRTVGFAGSTQRVYTLYGSTNVGSGAWQVVNGCEDWRGIGTNTVLIDTNAVLRTFYRVSVSFPP